MPFRTGQRLKPFLTLQDATFRLGDRLVFEGTNWQIHQGEQWAIVGGNGSGKSILADGLRGRLPLVHGELRYHFRPPENLSHEETIGHVAFEDRKSELHGEVVQSRWTSFEEEAALSVEEFLSYERVMEVNPFEVDARHGPARRSFEKRLRRAIGLFQIDGFLPRTLLSLSNGERQRVQLARALAQPLRLLILDEPYIGLDKATREYFHRMLEGLLRTNLKILVLTARGEELPRHVTHLLVVDGCRVVDAGPKEEVWARGGGGVGSGEWGVRSAECGVRSAECGGRNAEGGGRSEEGGGRSEEGGGRGAECGIPKDGGWTEKKGAVPGIVSGPGANARVAARGRLWNAERGTRRAEWGNRKDGRRIQKKGAGPRGASGPGINARVLAGGRRQIGSPRYSRPEVCATLVEMREVTVRYGKATVLDRVNWAVREGESWALLGPNGSGKTTLLSLIQGDHPQAYVNDVTIFGRRRGTGESVWEIKRKIGWVSPELQLHFDDTVSVMEVVLSGFEETIGIFETPTRSQRSAARGWLKRFDLLQWAEQPLFSLSAGLQRMTLLARALVKMPRLLILDEPCQGLDAGHRELIIRNVDELIREGAVTAIFVTHRPEEIPGSIARVLRLKGRRGR